MRSKSNLAVMLIAFLSAIGIFVWLLDSGRVAKSLIAPETIRDSAGSGASSATVVRHPVNAETFPTTAASSLAQEPTENSKHEKFTLRGHVAFESGGSAVGFRIAALPIAEDLVPQEVQMQIGMATNVTNEQGLFAITLPKRAFDSRALIVVSDRTGETSFLRKIVPIDSRAELLIPRSDDSRVKPLIGAIRLVGESSVDKCFVSIENTSTRTVLAYNANVKLTLGVGRLSMPNLKRHFNDAEGPVSINIIGDHGPNTVISFETLGRLREAISNELIVPIKEYTINVPPLGNDDMPETVMTWPMGTSVGYARSHKVKDGSIKLLAGTEDRVYVRGESLRSKRFALTQWEPGVQMTWKCYGPGDFAHVLKVQDAGGSPIVGSKVTFLLTAPFDTTTPSGWFSRDAKTDKDGIVRVAGLHQGQYTVSVQVGNTVFKYDVYVPGGARDVTINTLEKAYITVGRAQCMEDNVRLCYRKVGSSSPWKCDFLGVGLPAGPVDKNYIDGLECGSYDILAITGACDGSDRVSIEPSPSGKHLHCFEVNMTPAQYVAGQVLDSNGQPIGGLLIRALSDIDNDEVKKLCSTRTDVDGRFRVRKIGAAATRAIEYERNGTTEVVHTIPQDGRIVLSRK